MILRLKIKQISETSRFIGLLSLIIGFLANTLKNSSIYRLFKWFNTRFIANSLLFRKSTKKRQPLDPEDLVDPHIVKDSLVLKPFLQLFRLLNIGMRSLIRGSLFLKVVEQYGKTFLVLILGLLLLGNLLGILSTERVLLAVVLLLGLLTFGAIMKKPALGIFLLILYVPVKWGLRQIYAGPEILFSVFGPLLLVLVFAGYFLSQDFSKRFKLPLTIVDKLLLLLLATTLLSNINSYFGYYRLGNLLVESLVWVQSIILFYLVRANFTSPKWLKRLLAFSFVLVTFVALGGIYQYFTGWQSPEAWVESYDAIIKTRVVSVVGNPNGLAGYLNVFFLMGFSLMLFIKNNKFRFLLLIILGIIVLASLFTYSRGAWIALVGGLLFLTSVYDRRFFVLFILLLMVSPLFLPEAVTTRITNIFDPQHLASSARGGRLWSIQNVLHILPNHLWLGVGLGMYGGTVAVTRWSPVYAESINGQVAIPYVDNQFFQILIQQGIIGFAMFLVFAFSIIYFGLKVYQSLDKPFYRSLALGILSVWIAYWIQGLVASVMEFPQISIPVWLLLGLLFNLKKIEKLDS